MTDPYDRIDAVLALHRRGDWTEAGWQDFPDGLECLTCGPVPCAVPEALAVVKAAGALNVPVAMTNEPTFVTLIDALAAFQARMAEQP